MEYIIRKQTIEETLVHIMQQDGYLVKELPDGTLAAGKGKEQMLFYIAGYAAHSRDRGNEFYRVFFKLMKHYALAEGTYVIVLARAFRARLKQEAAEMGAAWRKLANSFPGLELWLVDPEAGRVEKTHWLDWADPVFLNPEPHERVCFNCQYLLWGIGIGAGLRCTNPLNRNAAWACNRRGGEEPVFIPGRTFSCEHFTYSQKAPDAFADAE